MPSPSTKTKLKAANPPISVLPGSLLGFQLMKLAIFDKDGTLTTTKSGAKFVQHPEDQVLLPGVAEGIAALAADGWAIAITSNQGGVAAGHKTIQGAIAEMAHCLRICAEAVGLCQEVDGKPQQVQVPHVGYFCPDEGDVLYVVRLAPDGTVSDHRYTCYQTEFEGFNFRKPRPGMLRAAGMAFKPMGNGYGLPDLAVGDRPEDEQAAAAAGVPFQWADKWRAKYQ